MNENEQRKLFLQQLAVKIKKFETERFNIETKFKEPTLWEIADGYRGFIQDLGPGFMEIAENYNVCMQIAKRKKFDWSKIRIKCKNKRLF